MAPDNKWEGRSRGGITGHRIFVFILKVFGLRVAYFFLRFVAFYFFVTARSTKTVLKYFREIIGYRGLKAYIAAYHNYYLFGQVLLDKVALLSGMDNKYQIEHEGHQENLKHLREGKTGSILLSAHIGNWEIAGQKLDLLQTRFNVLMYDNEIAQMKDYMNNVMAKRNFNVIAIREGEMSHLVELHRAFKNKELLVMHGDRFLPGTETVTKQFMGRPAYFPKGPFILASKFGVPVTVVFSMKDSDRNYHFYAKKAITVPRAKTNDELERVVADASDVYVRYLEEMVKKYPLQWFNFYDFWA
jgi:predicted LPLAT superfamily acyltransferase